MSSHDPEGRSVQPSTRRRSRSAKISRTRLAGVLGALVALLAALSLTQFLTTDRSVGKSPIASPSPGVAASQPATGGAGPALLEPDGGLHFMSKFPGSLPDDPAYFPIGVWLESIVDPPDVAKDKAAGLNTYVGLVPTSNIELAAREGMHVLAQIDVWASRPESSSATLKGWLLPDEIDMNEGPKKGPKTLAKTLESIPANDRRLVYANYGKGVIFWETDVEAKAFVNNYSDIVSADTYWFTDRDVCHASQGGQLLGAWRQLPPEQCHLAANYGRTIDRVRSLIEPKGAKPVWSFVEVGHPSSENDWPTITPPQIRAAVWSGIIHGARGIVYFNHSFGGSAVSQHALREPAYAETLAAVKRINEQITQLAPVLNAPIVTGILKGASPAVTGGVKTTSGVYTTKTTDLLLKFHDGHIYVLAGSATPAKHTTRFSLPCVGDATAVVLGEERTIAVKGGVFEDVFEDGNAVHLYRLDGGSTCHLEQP